MFEADRRFGHGSMAKHAAIVMAMTVLSGLLGVLREVVFAHRFATSDAYAAYVTAFSLIDVIYALVIGGALGSAFIPVFTGYLVRRDDRGAWKMASTVLNLALLAALLLAGLVFVLAPWLIRWFVAPGFDAGQRALVVRLTRVLLLQPILLGIGGLAMAVLNAFRRFLLTSLAPLVYNLCIIAGALFLAPRWGIYGPVAGVLVGAGLYLPLLLPGLILCGMRYIPSLDWREPGVQEVARLLLPRLLGQALFQINLMAIKALASFRLSQGVATLWYAYRLFGLPLGILGVSLASVAFPTLAALANEGRQDDFRHTLSRLLRVTLFLALPLAALMMALRTSLVAFLFQHGAFTAADTRATAHVFLFFALGLPAACVTEIVLRSFYALHDTRTPVWVGTGIVTANIALGAGLLPLLGAAGLALAFSVTNTAEMGILLLLLRKRTAGLEEETLLRSAVRGTLAAALAGLAASIALPMLERLLPGASSAELVQLAGAAATGAAVYLLVAVLVRSPEPAEAWAVLRRRFANDR
jgi:putative peptidoglycan lipid II flippase